MKSNTRSLGLSILRIVIGVLLLKNAIFYFPMANQLFGKYAIYRYDLYLYDMNQGFFKWLIYPFNLPYAPQLFLVVMIILSALFILAIGERFIGIILYMMVMILKLRNELILDGSDNVIQVIFPFLILAHSYDYFRYIPKKDVKITKWHLYYDQLAEVAAYGLMIQVCFVYFFTALEKSQGKVWLNGTAIYYTMRVDEFRATPWNIALTSNHYFVVLFTYFTLIWEQAFAFLVWFKRTKYFILIAGIFLHIGIWIFMRIDNFSWVMIGSYFVFVTNKEYYIISMKTKKILAETRIYLSKKLNRKKIYNHSSDKNILK